MGGILVRSIFGETPCGDDILENVMKSVMQMEHWASHGMILRLRALLVAFDRYAHNLLLDPVESRV